MTKEDAIFAACVGNHRTHTPWMVVLEEEEGEEGEYEATPAVLRNAYEDADEVMTINNWQEEFGVNEEGSPEDLEEALRALIRYYDQD